MSKKSILLAIIPLLSPFASLDTLYCGDISIDECKGGANISTSGGDIAVYLPDDINADIDAEIGTTYGIAKDFKIVSDFPIEMSKDRSGSRVIIAGIGKINSGGNLIKLRTSSGDISIKKYGE